MHQMRRKTLPFYHIRTTLTPEGVETETQLHYARYSAESSLYPTPGIATRPNHVTSQERITHHLFKGAHIRDHLPGAKPVEANILLQNDERGILERTSFCDYHSEGVYAETFLFHTMDGLDNIPPTTERLDAVKARLLDDVKQYAVKAKEDAYANYLWSIHQEVLAGEMVDTLTNVLAHHGIPNPEPEPINALIETEALGDIMQTEHENDTD